MLTRHFRTDAGECFLLTDDPGSRLGAGGQGRVFLARIGGEEMAVKLVQPLDPSRLRALQLLEARCGSLATLPKRLVFEPSAGDRLAGYAMRPLASDRSISCARLYNFEEIAKLKRFSWRDAVLAALRLAESVAALHRCGVVIGDLNPENVLFEHLQEAGGLRTWRAVLLDSDSFQIQAPGGGRHHCPVSRPPYTAPELIGCDFRSTWRHSSADDFALAVVIYQLLLHDHPFDNAIHMQEPDLDVTAKIRRGLYPHAATPHPALKAGPLRPAPAEISEAIHRAFQRSFQGEAHQRPTAAQWVQVLKDLHQRVVPCKASAHHHHPIDKACPWCALESRAGDPFCRFPTAEAAAAAATTAPASQPDSPPAASARPAPAAPATYPAATPAEKGQRVSTAPFWITVLSGGLLLLHLVTAPERSSTVGKQPEAVRPAAEPVRPPTGPGQAETARAAGATAAAAREAAAQRQPALPPAEPLPAPAMLLPPQPPVARTPLPYGVRGASPAAVAEPQPVERSCLLLNYRGIERQRMGCRLSSRVNSHGHTIYELTWADGEHSLYVFWRSGRVEVLSTTGSGLKTEAYFSPAGTGIDLQTREGLTIQIPDFRPTLN